MYYILVQRLDSTPACVAQKEEQVLYTTCDRGHARYVTKEYQFVYPKTYWKIRYEWSLKLLC